jgi:type VI secretion system protein ImpF
MGLRPVFSIVDRLVRPSGPNNRTDIASLKETVRRDLESLLNTRRSSNEEYEEYPLLSESVRNFGIPDFSTHELRQRGRGERVASSIAEAIRIYEPRLYNVSVTVLEESGMPEDTASLAFRIRAELRVLNLRERIRVRAFLDEGSGRLLPNEIVTDT